MLVNPLRPYIGPNFKGIVIPLKEYKGVVLQRKLEIVDYLLLFWKNLLVLDA